MIIVKLKGGLGNQMFQYACGRALSLRLNTKLILDISDYKNKNWLFYPFFLFIKRILFSVIKIVPVANKYKLFKNFIYWYQNPRYYNLNYYNIKAETIKNKGKYQYTKSINQISTNFGNEFEQFEDNTYIDGFWQSEKYFLPFSETIIKELSLTKMPKSKYIKQINETNSVSVHVRLGDYRLSDSNYGIISVEYFKKAIEYICNNTFEPVFYIFSDEKSEAVNLIKKALGNSKYIIIENSKNYIDLYLMTLCKHNLVTNSSFGWWGAFLNTNNKKIVIAPARPFTNAEWGEALDYYPQSWIKI